jgi:hypothetical protein
MSTLDRATLSGGLFIASGIAGLFWLYLAETARPLMQKFAGPFQSQWELLQWAVPTACLILMFVAGLYLVFGGVQKEKARNVNRRQR